jgi:hypothetical protein
MLVDFNKKKKEKEIKMTPLMALIYSVLVFCVSWFLLFVMTFVCEVISKIDKEDYTWGTVIWGVIAGFATIALALFVMLSKIAVLGCIMWLIVDLVVQSKGN